MPGSVGSSGCASASSSDHVEVVQGDRVRPRAMYRNRAFRLMSDDSMRYRWRCSVSACPSRLATDKFGEEHVLFNFVDHDEKEHRDAEEKRQRKKAYRSEAVVKIGEFLYVLEKTFSNAKGWRCHYVSCSGRCRTSLDGETLLLGPTPHTCDPQKAQQTRPTHDQPPPSPSEGVADTSADVSVHQSQLKHQQQQQMEITDKNEDDYEPALSPNVSLSEGPPSHCQASGTAADMRFVEAVSDSGYSHETSSRTPKAAGAPDMEAGPAYRRLGSGGQTSTPRKPSQDTTVKMDSSDNDFDDDEMDEEESLIISDDEEDEGEVQRSRSRGAGQSNLAGIGSLSTAAETLEMARVSYASADNKQRAEIYQRLCCLLDKEERLVDMQTRNEIRKQKLLNRQMKKEP
ncbi:hypothetical protein HPB50_016827 [Hyalomma asiaticum]|uniref:Uncharacterized protein n=1 Tax=Hyalomma asiaticum TaxID=266040 RepID=A0ACB7S1Y6_HYAAI|nr:hypothetical protein HPB50_016827 [Hyalomma asiaticum]